MVRLNLDEYTLTNEKAKLAPGRYPLCGLKINNLLIKSVTKAKKLEYVEKTSHSDERG